MPTLGTALGLTRSRKAGPLTPPTLAPTLSVSAESGSLTANLQWTPSNKTTSLGFGYGVYRNGVLYADTVLLSIDVTDVAGLLSCYIVPYNDAGNGPSSNTSQITLPGI
jgi:hypothetical protein